MSDNQPLAEALARAEKLFTDSYNCTQSVLQVVQAYYGIEDENLWRLATGLGAGISRRGSVCGALTGGAAAFGLVSGHRRRSGHDDRVPLREDTYAKTQQLIRRFEERFGTIECLRMTGCDFRTPEGRQAFKDTRQMDKTCIPAVRLAIENVIALLG